MDDFFEHPDEGLISQAIRRRRLPPEHPAHFTWEQYDEFMRAGIKAAEARAKRDIEALHKAGLGDARI